MAASWHIQNAAMLPQLRGLAWLHSCAHHVSATATVAARSYSATGGTSVAYPAALLFAGQGAQTVGMTASVSGHAPILTSSHVRVLKCSPHMCGS